jgi:hypothetical protein
MKTNFKTNGRIRKESATLKSVIIAATLVITGVAASAQGVWGTYFENNQETAFLWADANVKSNKLVNSETEASFAAFAAYLVEENEEKLAIEEWMTDTENFGTFINIEEETESPLQLEDWMLNEKAFVVKNEKEEPLKVENWMTAENVWK